MSRKEITYNSAVGAYQHMYISSVKFKIIILFVFSVFLISSDDTFKIASMNASSITAMLMVGIFILEGFISGHFVLQRHPAQLTLFLLLCWATISLLASNLFTYKAISDEAYFYEWAVGLNSPAWRGLSFLIRLLLSIFAIEFIISNIDTKEKFIKVINYFILTYSIMCLFVFIQIILFAFFDMTIGYILPPRFEGYFPVGGYVGESGTLAAMIVSGYFICIAMARKHYPGIWFSSKFLKILCVVSTIDLLFTFSAAWIMAAMISFFIIGRKYINRKILIFALSIIILASILYVPFQQVIILRALEESSTLNVRTYSWIAGLSIVKNNITSGVGIGQSVFFMPQNLTDIADKFLDPNVFAEMFLSMRFPPMNTYIQLMSETGIIGVIILASVYYILIKCGREIKNHEFQNLINFGFGGGLIAVAIAMNAGPDNLYVGYINFLLAMYIAGIMLCNDSCKRNSDKGKINS